MNKSLDTRLDTEELDIVSGGKNRGTWSEGDTYDIRGKGLLTIGTTTLPSGQVVPFAAWEPGQH
jgi:hypothetical protein